MGKNSKVRVFLIAMIILLTGGMAQKIFAKGTGIKYLPEAKLQNNVQAKMLDNAETKNKKNEEETKEKWSAFGKVYASETNNQINEESENSEDEFSALLGTSYESEAPKLDTLELSSTFTSENEIEVYLKTTRNDIEKIVISGWSGGAYQKYQTTKQATYDSLREIYTVTFELSEIVNTKTNQIETKDTQTYYFDACVYGENNAMSYYTLDNVEYTKTGFTYNVATSGDETTLKITAEDDGEIAILKEGEEITEETKWQSVQAGENEIDLLTQNSSEISSTSATSNYSSEGLNIDENEETNATYQIVYKSARTMSVTSSEVAVYSNTNLEDISSYHDDETYTFEISEHETKIEGIEEEETQKTLGWISYTDTPEIFESTIQGQNGETATAIIKIKTEYRGILSFDYMVSSETEFDTFTFEITVATPIYENGETESEKYTSKTISGIQTWQNFTRKFEAPANGEITLKLTYSKDKNVKVGEDKAAIRNLKFTKMMPNNGTLVINNGDEFATEYDLNLKITVEDAEYMYISEDMAKPSANDSNWVPLQENYVYTLQNKLDGEKTIYVWFKDSAGTLSEVATTATIKLDGIEPSDDAPEASSTATTIKVILKQTDANTFKKTEYGYKIANTESEYTWIEADHTKEYEITGLSEKTNYEIATRVTDGIHNVTSKSLEIKTKISNQNINIAKTPANKTLEDVDVTITWNAEEGQTKKYSLDNITWQEETAETTKIHMSENGSIYYEITDGTYTTGILEYKVDNIDREGPEVESVSIESPVSGKYGIDDEITIKLKWNEEVEIAEAPVLNIKFSDGTPIALTKIESDEVTITYKYTIVPQDSGYLTIDSLTGGMVCDSLNNIANYTLPAQTGSTIYAENAAYIESKNQYYATLQNAIKAAGEEKTTIKIVANTELRSKVVIKENQDITIDLNGKTISFQNNDQIVTAIENSGKLKIIDSTNQTNIESQGKIIATSSKKSAYTIINNNKGKLNIEQGTIEATSNSTSVVLESYAIYNKESGEITLGKDDAKISTSIPKIKATSKTSTGIKLTGKGGVLNYYDGVVMGTENSVEATSGANAYVMPTGYMEKIEDVKENNFGYKKSYLSNEVAVELTMNGQTTHHLTLLDALAKVPTDGRLGSIKIIADEMPKDIVKIYSGQNIEIDLNGHTIKRTEALNGAVYTIINNGTLVLKDLTEEKAGRIEAIAQKNLPTYAVYNMENADLTIDGVTLFANINLETSSSVYYGLYCSNAKKIKFYGGKIYNKNISIYSVSSNYTNVYLNPSQVQIKENEYIHQGVEEIDGIKYKTNYLSSEPVVTLEVSGEIKGFSTIHKAISSITGSEEVKITFQNGEELFGGISIPKNRNIVIDLNGNTLSSNEKGNIITSNATMLKVQDSLGGGTLVAKSRYGACCIKNEGNGELYVNNITISSIHESMYSWIETGIYNAKNGCVYIEDVKIYNTGDSYGIYNASGGEVRMQETEIHSSGWSARGIYNNGNGLIYLENVLFEGIDSNCSGIYNNQDGKIYFCSGTIQNYNNGIYNNQNGKICINGGEIISEKGYGLYINSVSGEIVIEGGELKDLKRGIYIKDGMKIKNDGEYATGYINLPIGKCLSVKQEGKYRTTFLTDGNCVAVLTKPNGELESYFSIKEATENVLTDNLEYKIKMIQNEVLNESLEIAEGKKIEIDLNGKEILGGGLKKTIINKGILTIVDSAGLKSNGFISADGKNGESYGIYNEKNGTVVINSGKIAGTQCGICNVNEGTIEMNGGIIETNSYGIYNKSIGIIRINKGNIIVETGLGIYNANKGEIIIGENNGIYCETPNITAEGAISIHAMGAVVSFNNGILRSTKSNIVYPANTVFEHNEGIQEEYYAINIPEGAYIKDVREGSYYIKTLTNTYNKATYKVSYINNGENVEKYYWSLYSAINETPSNIETRITVLEDVEETSSATVSSDQNIILDLIGNNINFENDNGITGITNSGKLQIIDSSEKGGGTIEVTSKTGMAYGIYNNSSSAVLTIGENDGIVSSNSPRIIGGYYGIYKYKGTLNIYDGIFEGVDSIYGSANVPTSYTLKTISNSDGTEKSCLVKTTGITIVPEKSGWINENQKIKIYYKDSQNINQYKIADGKLQTLSTGTLETNLEIAENAKIYAQTVDTNGNILSSGEYEITNIDKTKPIVENITITNEVGTKQTITVTGAKDEEKGSGLKGYLITMDSKEPRKDADWIELNSSTFSGEVDKNGIWYVYVIDNAGNISEQKSILAQNIDSEEPIVINIEVTSPETGMYGAETEVTFSVNYSEDVTIEETPTLKIRFGTGDIRKAILKETKANQLIYTYIIQAGDWGALELYSFDGGIVKDLIGNEYKETDIELVGNKIEVQSRAYIAETNTYYKTLKEAIEACSNTAEEYTTIKMINNDNYYNVSLVIKQGQKIKIDLNSYEISIVQTGKAIINNGGLVIDDTSENKSGIIACHYYIYSNGCYCIYNASGGRLEVNAGMITSANSNSIYNESNASVTVNGGIIASTSSSNCGIDINKNSKVIITGGEFKGKPNGIYIPSGMQIKNSGDYENGYVNIPEGKYIAYRIDGNYIVNYLADGEVVAELIKPDGTIEKYLSIQDAILNSSGDGLYKIKMLQSESLCRSIEIEENQNIEIDLNDNEIYAKNIEKAIINKGNLIIDDTSENNLGTINFSTFGIYNVASGNLTLSKGTITSKSSKSNEFREEIFTYGIYNKSTGSVLLCGATIEVAVSNTSSSVSYYYSYCIFNESVGSIIVEDGSMLTVSSTAASAYAYGIKNVGGGCVNVTECAINSYSRSCYLYGYSGAYGIYNSNGGKVETNGSTIKSAVNPSSYGTNVCYGIYNSSLESLIIKGGTVIAYCDYTVSSVYGIYVANVKSKIIITGGEFKGKTNGIYIPSGMQIKNSGDYANGYVNIPEGKYIAYSKEDDYVVNYLADDKAVVELTKPDGTIEKYLSIQDAVLSSSGDELYKIKMLQSESLGRSIEIAENQNIEIDLNGNDIYIQNIEKAIINYGNLTIDDTSENKLGTITSSYYAIYNAGTGNVEVNGGAIISSSSNSSAYGIYNTSSGSVEVNGGTITSSSYNSAYGIYFKNASSTFKFTAGKILARNYSIYPTNKLIELEPNTYVENYTEKINGTTYYIAEVLSGNILVSINGDEEYFSSLSAAFTKANTYTTKTTIKLLSDVEITSGININSGKNIVLDLNGYTVSYSKANEIKAFINNGTFEITDTAGGGKIEVKSDGYTAYGVYNATSSSYSNAKFKQTGGNIEVTSIGSNAYGIYNYYGNSTTVGRETIRIEDGSISAKAETGVNALTSGKAYGIYNDYYGSIVVTGAETNIYATSALSDSYGIYDASYSSSLILGENDGITGNASPRIIGGTYGIYKDDSNTFALYGGSVTGLTGKATNRNFTAKEANTTVYTVDNLDGTETKLLLKNVVSIEGLPETIGFGNISQTETFEVSYLPVDASGVTMEHSVSDETIIDVREENNVYTVRPKKTGTSTILITATDITGKQVYASTEVIVDLEPPTDTAPTATSTGTSITIVCKQEDNNLDINKTMYAYSEDGTLWSDWSNRATINGLAPDTIYFVRTKASDTFGNETISLSTKIRTKLPNQSEFTLEPSEMTKENVKVTITWNNDDEMPQYYKVDNGNWILANGETTEVEVSKVNTKIYTKLVYDGTEDSDIRYVLVDNIDRLAPTGSFTINESKPRYDGYITLNISTSDDATEVGDNAGVISYIYISEENIAPTEESENWIKYSGDTNAYPYTIAKESGEAMIYMWFMDKAKNISAEPASGEILYEPPVAVLIEDENIIGEYNSIALAYSAARENNSSASKIIVCQNTTLDSTLTIASSKNIILDLNGKTVTSALTTGITNNGTLEIADSKGNGKYVNTYSTSYAYAIYNNKNLIISSGDIEMINKTSGSYRACAIYNTGSLAKINMTGGRVYAETTRTTSSSAYSYPAYAIWNNSSLTSETSVSIKGGKVEAKGNNYAYAYGIYNYNSGKIVLENTKLLVNAYFLYGTCIINSGAIELINSNITVDSSSYAYGAYIAGSGKLDITDSSIMATSASSYAYGISKNSSGAVTINSGSISANGSIGYGIYNSNSSNSIKIGKDDGVVDNNLVTIIGSTYGIYRNSGTFYFYDGTIKGRANQSILCKREYLVTPTYYGVKKEIENNIETATLTFDNIAPTVESIEITNNTEVNKQTITVKGVEDEGVGIAAYYFSTSSTAPSKTSSNWNDITQTNGPIDITSDATENKTYYFFAIDGAGNISEAVSILAENIKIKLTSASMSNISLEVGDQKTVQITYNPTNAEPKSVSFESSDSSIAYINPETGVVTGVALGKATITANIINYDDTYIKATCSVTVSMNPPTILAEPQDRTVKEGTTVTYTVDASGKDLEYKWYLVSGDSEIELTEETNKMFKSNIEGQASTVAEDTIVINTNYSGELNFEYMVSSEANNDTFTITIEDANGERTLVDNISGEVDWTNLKTEFTPTEDGKVTLKLRYSKNGSIDSGLDFGAIRNLSCYYYFDLQFTATFDVAEDAKYLTYTDVGSYGWIKDGEIFRSNNKNINSSTSKTIIKIKVAESGTLSFDYKVSSETNYDKLTITLQGNGEATTVVNAISGNGSWKTYSATVTPDENNEITLTLSYTKDYSTSSNDDIGAIRNLKFDAAGYRTNISTFETDSLFTISSTNFETVTYAGVNTLSLTVPSAMVNKSANGTKYFVKVSNQGGTSTSRRALLTIAEEEIEVTEPTTKTAPTLEVGYKKITATSNQTGTKTYYAISSDDVTYGAWQESNVFENLDEGTRYFVKTKVINAEGETESVSSMAIMPIYVASLEENQNTTYYESLQEAVDSASNENSEQKSKITLLKSETRTSQITVESGKNISLDLNGNNLVVVSSNYSKLYGIYNQGNLEILDSIGNGEIKVSLSIASGYVAYGIYNHAGNLVIKSGNVNVIRPEEYKNYAYGVYNYAGGTTEIGENDGTVSVTIPKITSTGRGLYRYSGTINSYDGVVYANKNMAINNSVSKMATGYGLIEEYVGNQTKAYLEKLIIDLDKAMVMKWEIPANTTIKLPIDSSTNMNIVVDWGDGSGLERFIKTTYPSHTYEEAGTYTIRFSGTLNTFGHFYNYSSLNYLESSSDFYTFAKYLKTVEAWGELGATRYSFSYCENLESVSGNANQNSFENLQDMSFMFNRCYSLEKLDLSYVDTSNVTNMSAMFNNCYNLKELNISNFNTSNVTNMSYMFNDCYLIENLDLSSFNTSNVTTMRAMFLVCKNLKSIDLSNFDTKLVYDMSMMFSNCEQLSNVILTNLDTSNVYNMSYMFNACYGLSNLDISSFDTSNVSNMKAMFSECSSLENLDVSKFDTSNVYDMSYMFNDCEKLKYVNVSGFDTSNVTNMEAMFSECLVLKNLDLSHFNTSNVTNMCYMFNMCYELTSLDVSGFDTSNVTDMEAMFAECIKVEALDLSNFDTSNVTNMCYMFDMYEEYVSNLISIQVSDKFVIAEDCESMFWATTDLEKILLTSTIPAVDQFANVKDELPEGTIFYVPNSAESAYEEAWSGDFTAGRIKSILELVGDSNINLNIGEAYNDLGQKVAGFTNDEKSNYIVYGYEVSINGEVDTSQVGRYEIEYILTRTYESGDAIFTKDSNGNMIIDESQIEKITYEVARITRTINVYDSPIVNIYYEDGEIYDGEWTNQDVIAIIDIISKETTYVAVKVENGEWSVEPTYAKIETSGEQIKVTFDTSINGNVYFREVDVTGNATTYSSKGDIIKIDTEKPYVKDMVAKTIDGKIILSASVADDFSGISYFAITRLESDEKTWRVYSSTDGKIEGELSTSGRYYLWLKDSAGNISNGDFVDVAKDIEPPEGSIDIVATNIVSGDKYTNQDVVQININVTDNETPQDKILFAIYDEEDYKEIKDGKKDIEWKQYTKTVDFTLKETEGTNIIYAIFKDTAGNIGMSKESLKIAPASALMDLIPSIANVPVLGDGMKAVYWTNDDGDGETLADEYTSNMYSYIMGDGKTDSKDSKWANAVTTSDGSYWVWIPRYAYKITYTDEAKTEKIGQTTGYAIISGEKTLYGNIDILFMYEDSNTHYRDINGRPRRLPEGYKVHPAFQKMKEATATTSGDAELGNPLGKWDEELEGIWVAKYEASQETYTNGSWQASGTTEDCGGGNVSTNESSRIVSKPTRLSWRNITQSNIYTNSLNMHSALNSHEMKNSEWGAVAYLTQSAYGRNGNKVAVNQNQADQRSGYTGGGPGIGESDVCNDIYEYSDKTIYNANGEATTKGFSDYYAWNTEQGKKASTTGNIYGIYDMSGGAFEYVASYVDNKNSNITSSSSGGALGTSTDMRTKQVYKSAYTEGASNQNVDYALQSGVYGDAVYETSTSGASSNGSWQNVYGYFPFDNAPFFGRGGAYYHSSSAGIFWFAVNVGNDDEYIGFRTVLCVGSED